jgi:hypothetical protein
MALYKIFNMYLENYLTFIRWDFCFLFHGCCNIKYTGYVITSYIKEIVLKADNK